MRKKKKKMKKGIRVTTTPRTDKKFPEELIVYN